MNFIIFFRVVLKLFFLSFVSLLDRIPATPLSAPALQYARWLTLCYGLGRCAVINYNGRYTHTPSCRCRANVVHDTCSYIHS